MATFRYDGQRLAYTVYGRGPRTTVLMPALLLSQKMQAPLAKELAARGNRVITFDPLGHGESDRPRDMWRYSMTEFAHQALALLDRLKVEQAVVGGTSMGANITLEFAALAPERLRGMILEMPVLDNAIPACAIAFTPLLLWLTFGEPIAKRVAYAARARPPGRRPVPARAVARCRRPGPGAERRRAPGHHLRPHRAASGRAPDLRRAGAGDRPPRDPVHPFSDADMLAHELPNSRLIDASSIVELRVRPARLTAEIADFVDDCWGVGAGERERAESAA